MSHFKLREAKDCLNCGAIVEGLYCSACGQENREPRISFFALVTHFISDIVHFDGKFFTSLKALFFKPGLLPKNFIAGKRVSYVDPIRMYIFTSAISFFIFFLIVKPDEAVNWNSNNKALNKVERDSLVKVLNKKLITNPTSATILNQLEILKDTSKVVSSMELIEQTEDFKIFSFGNKKYKSKSAYDSVQNKLSAKDKDGWFAKKLMYKEFEIKEKYTSQGKSTVTAISEIFLHKLPILLFVSLPIFALILKLLYVRSKKYFFVDHSIFSIYHYIFSFFIFIILLLLKQTKDYFNWQFISYIRIALILYWFVYLHKSLRNFYEQRSGKTIIKLLFISFLGFVTTLVLFVLFLFLSVFQL